MRPLLIHGASGHGLVVADTAEAAGFGPIVFSDDEPAKRGADRLGWPVEAIGVDEEVAWLRRQGGVAVVAIGSNRARARAAVALRERGVPLATVVHPRSYVSSRATLGPGTVVFAGAVVQPAARRSAPAAPSCGTSPTRSWPTACRPGSAGS